MTSNRVFRKQSTTKKQKKPFQMGLEVKVPSLRLTGKKQYAMENLQSFKFPRTSAQLKSGELGILINGLTLIEELVNILETKFNYGQTEKEPSMDRILKERKKRY